MKKISIVIPTYNEEENIQSITSDIVNIFSTDLIQFDYEIIVIDNYSKDNTKQILESICKENRKIKGIFNARNFGQFNSPFYALLQAQGDCVILMAADYQDPLYMIKEFAMEWEKGYKIVIGIKKKSQESKILYSFRSLFYIFIKAMSRVDQIEHFTGFGLYDQDFIKILRSLEDPNPYLRGIVAELGYNRKEINYEQGKRQRGKTSNNFFTLYDAAMVGLTSYTKIGLRISTFIGFIFSFLSVLVGFYYLVMKLLHWNSFNAGIIPLIIFLFMFNSIQLVFLGFMGEYILSINQRTMKRPLVIEEKRINF
jgi:polyisoprenyl-phosphate glycosyltransferase